MAKTTLSVLINKSDEKLEKFCNSDNNINNFKKFEENYNFHNNL